MCDQLINDFNETLLYMLKDIAQVCPKSLIGINIQMIEGMINNSQNKTLFIDIFLQKVLIYKKEIKEGNESFFMNQSFDKDAEGDSYIIGQIMEFKNIWKDLSTKNKEIIVMYMSMLCDLADSYLLNVTS